MSFHTTLWRELGALTLNDDPAHRKSLDAFLRRYEEPVLQFIRARWSCTVPSAEDVAQDFWLKLLESRLWRRADSTRGKFRTFLLVVLTNYLRGAITKLKTGSRGGGVLPLSLDEMIESGTEVPSPSEQDGAELDHKMALSILQRAVVSVRNGLPPEDASRTAALLACLQGALSHQAAASTMGLSAPAIRTAVSRLRSAIRDAMLDEVTSLVQPGEEHEEMQYLQSLLLRNPGLALVSM